MKTLVFLCFTFQRLNTSRPFGVSSLMLARSRSNQVKQT